MTDLPDGWLPLTAYQRDILVTLVNDGEVPGGDLHDHFKDVDRRESTPTMYSHLNGLVDAGLVEVEEKDGRENIYRAAPTSVCLVDKVGRVISGSV